MSLDTLTTAETPEGIALSLRPAGLVPRVLAFAADFGIRVVLFLIVSTLLRFGGGLGSGLQMMVFFLLEWFYPVAFELALGGATPGKRMMGLQVTMDSGLPVTPAASITRNLLRAADFLPLMYGFGVLAMLWRPDFKRLGDLAAGTLVVHAGTVELHGTLPDAPPRAPARPLALREQAAIVNWAMRAQRLTPARFDELAVLAESATGPGDGAAVDRTQRLLGVAHWLLGRRGTDAR